MKARFSISGAVLAVLLLVSTSSAAEKPGATSSGLRLSKSLGDGSATTTMSINNINLWVTKHGAFPPDWSGCGCASSESPIGGPGLIFQEGYLYGVKVTDDSSTAGSWPRVRVNGATHAHGLKAGKVLYGTDGKVTGPADFTDAQVWRVRRDYKTADLTRDAATFEAIPAEDVTKAMKQETYDGYVYDWTNWPADQGAPFDDVDGDGVYDPAVDIPGYPGADMTVWTVANDLPRADGTQVSTDSYGSVSTGVELQFTIWAYAFAADNPLGNIIFKRFRMIYTGVPGASETCKLDTVYFVNWSDPDLGDYSDDYVGCDTLLSLGYVYNANTLDAISYGDYGLPVAAGGYDFLQGPITAEGDTLGMSSFTFFGAGSGIEDPDQYVYNGSLQYFNLMEGFLPDPAYPVQEPFTDYITGEATKFVHSGDPVTGEGWIDGLSLPPGDRRLVMSTGPFEMALGDTQDIVVALIGATGGDNLSSVTVLKYYDLFAQYAYDQDFTLPGAPTMPKVEAFAGDGYISLFWGRDLAAVAATEEPVKAGFQFEGYNIYQLPSAAATPSEGIKLITYDLANGITTILEKTVDPATGQVLDLPAQTGGDAEFRRDMVVDRDALRNRPISNDIAYFFGISAYSFLPGAEAAGSPFQSLESGMSVISVYPQVAAPGVTLDETPAGDLIDVVHTGTAGGFVRIHAIDPADFTGHDYEVFFDLQHYYMDFDGQWKFTNYPDSVGKALGKVLDLTGSTVSAIAYTSPTAGTRDLKFIVDLVAPDYDYSDGLSLTFPPEIVINSAEDAVGNVYGSTYEPVVDTDANTVVWGAPDITEDGDFSGGEVFTVNVETPTLPLDVDYWVFDDGWAAAYCADNPADCDAWGITDPAVVHSEGICTITEEALAFKTEKYWNLKDVTTGEILFEDQAILNGVDIYTGETWDPSDMRMVHGFRPNVSVGYAAPLDFESAVARNAAGEEYDTDTYDFGSYAVWFGYETALAADTYPDSPTGTEGSSDILLLQKDLEFRFTGVYDDSVEHASGLMLHPIKPGTGSIATFVGFRNYDIDLHPMADDVSTARGPLGQFLIRVPFEVWDVESDPAVQVNLIMIDREQDPKATSGPFYAHLPTDRTYSWVLHTPYDSTSIADVGTEDAPTGDDLTFLTWNQVWYLTDWTIGDVVEVVYANPIVLGSDVWNFSTTAPTLFNAVLAEEAVEMINVFPNPYYGYQVLERSRAAKWMRFNHLPTDHEVTIRIFNLGGIMVRTIVKSETDGTQYAEWNLLNQAGYPVASGIYIAFIEIDGVDKTKILKLAIVQEVQILDVY